MSILMGNPAFRVFAACAVMLTMKMFMVAFYTTITRKRFRAFINPEDTRISQTPIIETEAPEVQRVMRAHRNDLENIPAFYIIGLLFVLTGATPLAAKAYFGLYTFARFSHTAAYLNQLQPWRSIAYTVGQMCMLGMMVQIVQRVL